LLLGAGVAPAAATTGLRISKLQPKGTLEFSVPEVVTAGKRFAITTSIASGSAGVGLYLDLKRLPAHGPPCAPSDSAEPRRSKLVVADGHSAKATKHARLKSPGVYVACAWLESIYGTVDGPFSGRIVVLARHQHPVQFLGITSQRLLEKRIRNHYPVSFREVDGQLVDASYFARYTCKRAGHRTTHPIYSTTFPAFPIATTGQFLDVFAEGTDTASMGGRIRGKRATGKFSETYLSGGYVCRSGPVSFSART
jgi:hypothetical protein